MPSTVSQRRWSKKWYYENQDHILAIKRNHYLENRKRILEKKRLWGLLNPGLKNARRMRAIAYKLQATPPWLTTQQFRDIEAVYIEARKRQDDDGVKRNVDHVYPLKGKTCCGLHVPWNLQILVERDNIKKYNHMPATARTQVWE